MGRAGADPLARPPGGGEDRAVLARLLRDPVLRGVGARHPRWPSRSCSGVTRGSGCRWWGRRWRPCRSCRTARRQIGEWCPQMFGDGADVKLGAFCSSEPDAGSDVAAIRTRAVYDKAGDEWVINGVKTWATNGGIANVHVVVASVDPSLGCGARRPSSCRRVRRASPRGRSSRSTASARRTLPRSSLTTCGCPVAAWSAARRSWTAASPGYARAPAAASRPR